MTVIIGLDLSLTSTGICCLPLDWDCTPSRCRVETVPYKRTPHCDTERAARLATVARRIIAAAQELADGKGITAWGIESLPTHNAHAVVPLAELHGCVRLLLHDRGQQVVTVPQASARKLLLGTLPRKDVKEIVRRVVTHFDGCGAWGPDEVDAFVAVNWLVSEDGGVALAAGAARNLAHPLASQPFFWGANSE